MSLNAATIEILLAKGLTGDDLLAVARAMETRKADPTNAERQSRHRAKVNNAVTVTRYETDEALSPQSPPKVSPGPLSNTPPIPPKPETILAQARFALSGDIPAEPFADFVQMRKKIGAPMTDRAKDLAVTKLRKLRDEDGWPPGDVLNHCTMNSYRGIFPPPKDQKNGRQQHHPNIGKSQAAWNALAPSADEPF